MKSQTESYEFFFTQEFAQISIRVSVVLLLDRPKHIQLLTRARLSRYQNIDNKFKNRGKLHGKSNRHILMVFWTNINRKETPSSGLEWWANLPYAMVIGISNTLMRHLVHILTASPQSKAEILCSFDYPLSKTISFVKPTSKHYGL